MPRLRELEQRRDVGGVKRREEDGGGRGRRDEDGEGRSEE